MKFKLISALLIITTFLTSCNKSNNENNNKPSSYYKGGWPINSKSHEIQNPDYNLPCPGPIGCECNNNLDCNNDNCVSHPRGNYCAPKKGDIIPRFTAIDQFGESVDLYDFSKQGKMILIELSTAWCSPCRDVASWITHNDLAIRDNPWWNDRYLPIRNMVQTGEILMVNFLFEGNERKVTVTQDDVVSWYNQYPNPNITILTDKNRDLHSWVKPTGLPCIFLIDENMRLINYTSRGLTDAFLYLTQASE